MAQNPPYFPVPWRTCSSCRLVRRRLRCRTSRHPSRRPNPHPRRLSWSAPACRLCCLRLPLSCCCCSSSRAAWPTSRPSRRRPYRQPSRSPCTAAESFRLPVRLHLLGWIEQHRHHAPSCTAERGRHILAMPACVPACLRACFACTYHLRLTLKPGVCLKKQ